ncbi:MAG: sel1 repeat family protein [Clostridiales bacterium]|nr:sel1 repeat family protein [Clostridiales bacterium]
MFEIERGMLVKDIATLRIGLVVMVQGDEVTVTYRDKSYIYPEYFDHNIEELAPAELPEVTEEELRDLIRGTLDLWDLSDSTIYLGQLEDKCKYSLELDDLLYGIRSLLIKPEAEKFCCYVYPFILYKFFLNDHERKDKTDEFDEFDFICYIIDCLICQHDLLVSHDDQALDIKELLQELEKNILDYKENGTIPDEFYRNYLMKNESVEKVKDLGPNVMFKFKRALDFMCDKDDKDAIRVRGYCYYTGNLIYDQNWYKARDSFLKYYEMTGDPMAANTLGYIYYYGRCNDGVAEYDKAFKYFSIGYAGGIFESTYKLGDMFANGREVVQNGNVAMSLYWRVYKECFEYFIRERYDTKFADVALRMGNCHSRGLGCSVDHETAYAYYLQAYLAIKKRMEVGNEYGDATVLKNIEMSLEYTRQYYTLRGRSQRFESPTWARWLNFRERNCVLKIVSLKDGSLMIEGRQLKLNKDEEFPPKILVVLTAADYCGLQSRLMVKTAPESSYEVFGNSEKILFNNVTYDPAAGVSTFWLNEIPVARITTKYYEVTAPTPEETEGIHGKKYHFVSVAFEGSKRRYDYLCDYPDIKPGDIVLVDSEGEKVEVEVMDVFDKFESELTMNIDKYKKVYKKD